MPLKRCIYQSSSNQTLIEFYKEVKKHNNSISEDIAINMLKLIEKLNDIFQISEIYALTSMYDLVLLSDNTWESKWIMKLNTNGTEHIIYEADNETNRLNKSTVYSNESEFVNKILELMRNSNYWNDVPELK